MILLLLTYTVCVVYLVATVADFTDAVESSRDASSRCFFAATLLLMLRLPTFLSVRLPDILVLSV